MPALTPGRRPRGGVLVGGSGLGRVGGLGGLHDFGLGFLVSLTTQKYTKMIISLYLLMK